MLLDWVKKLELFCLYWFECCKHGSTLSSQFIGWVAGAGGVAEGGSKGEVCS